jgi:5-bromo-4-chloroindolyl phosphate hydrolysis protein
MSDICGPLISLVGILMIILGFIKMNKDIIEVKYTTSHIELICSEPLLINTSYCEILKNNNLTKKEIKLIINNLSLDKDRLCGRDIFNNPNKYI